jgi:hypothetical protein
MNTLIKIKDARTMREQTINFITAKNLEESFEQCKKTIVERANSGYFSAECSQSVHAASSYFKHLGFKLKNNNDKNTLTVLWSDVPKEKMKDNGFSIRVVPISCQEWMSL